MTIIEAALEKTKARRNQSAEGAQGGPAGYGSASAAVNPAAARLQPTIAPPSTLIQGVPVDFDAKSARTRRVLIGRGDPEDRGILAAYGMLRTRILHRLKAKQWDTVGVTSAAPRDGKSLTTLNLAFSLARERNNSVVLIDLDMRNPTICPTLGIKPHLELRSYFEGAIETPAELFMSLGVANLLVAGNLTASQDAAELLASNRLEGLLDYIRRNTVNPLILIDLPPVVSPEDTLVVAPRINSLLLVASEGQTAREDLQRARDLLADFPLVGIVLNRSTQSVQRYGYEYGYGGGNDLG